MQLPLRSNRDVRRPVIRCAMVAGVLALVATLAGAGGASGQDQLVAMQPFPVVRIAGEATATGTRVDKLTVKGPVAAVVVTTCTPRSKCPYGRRSRLIGGPQGATRTVSIDELQRRYHSGATLRVYVVKSGFIGKYASFAIRRRKQPKRYDRCLLGTVLNPVRCPES